MEELEAAEAAAGTVGAGQVEGGDQTTSPGADQAEAQYKSGDWWRTGWRSSHWGRDDGGSDPRVANVQEPSGLTPGNDRSS